VLNLQAGYSFHGKQKVTYLNDLVNLSKSISQNPDLHDTTNFHLFSARGFISNIPGRKFEYQNGFDLNHETADGKRTGGQQQITDVAGFLNLLYHPVKFLSLQPGLRFMYNSKYRAPLIYSVNVKFQIPSFVMRASYAKGFRAPSLKQLYLQFIDSNHEIYGNPELKPETADNISLDFRYSLMRNRHAVDASVNLFSNHIHQSIQLAISTDRPGWGTYFNVEGRDYTTRGAEVALRYRFSPGLTVTGGIVTTGRLKMDSSGDHAWSTDFSSSLVYRHVRHNLQGALFYKYTGDYLEFAGNYNAAGQLSGIAQQWIEGYHTLDLTFSFDFLMDRLIIAAGVKNIFDVTLVNAYGTLSIHGSSQGNTMAGYGRTYFIKLGFRFNREKNT
jgi:outer membrane receptor for ferrienterochelin and colicins